MPTDKTISRSSNLPPDLIWKLTLATAALLDIATCWSTLLSSSRWTHHQHVDTAPSLIVWTWHDDVAGTLFACLCVVQAVLQAHQARQNASDTAALDHWEQKLARLYASTRSSLFFNETDDRKALAHIRNLRLWLPVATTIFLWAILLPGRPTTTCGPDKALFSI